MASDLYTILFMQAKDHVTGFLIIWPYKIQISVY